MLSEAKIEPTFFPFLMKIFWYFQNIYVFFYIKKAAQFYIKNNPMKPKCPFKNLIMNSNGDKLE